MTNLPTALYFPILRAKGGEILAVAHLSPFARSRVRPLFDIQRSQEFEDRPSEYLAGLSEQLCESWGTATPLYVDFSKFSPEDRLDDGSLPIELFFEILRQKNMQAVPVAGPEIVRGPGTAYLDAVGRIASKDGRGAVLRMPISEYGDALELANSIDTAMGTLNLAPKMTDLLLDVEALELAREELRDRTGIVSTIDTLVRDLPRGFRTIVLCGSSVPERVPSEFNWAAKRNWREDLLAWRELLLRDYGFVLGFSDYGVIFAREQDIRRPVRPPARIRLSTTREHVMWRAPRKDYVELCSRVTTSPDFDSNLQSWGTTVLMQCARYGRFRGGPREWVARDTNRHIELTSRAIESDLKQAGLFVERNFPKIEEFPWDQPALFR